jgi:Kef-type K+ transport system membrane component KefB
VQDLLLLLLQIIVILGLARLVGWLFRKIRQPQVVGEMAAGIILGPSLLGFAAPGAYAFIFPSESLGYLNAISQVGLILFMFLIGLELDLNLLRGRGRSAVITSQVSVVVPFVLGILLAVFLYPRLSSGDVPFLVFAIFLGTAMSITAFPVLARILSERKMLRTQLGSVAIACAAVNDVTGWIILAVLMLLARASNAILPRWAFILEPCWFCCGG